MTTATVWLLISYGMLSRYMPSVMIDRFPTAADCHRVMAAMQKTQPYTMECIQATVVINR